jgi:hypothetical protein
VTHLETLQAHESMKSADGACGRKKTWINILLGASAQVYPAAFSTLPPRNWTRCKHPKGFWIPEANTPGNYGRVIPKRDRVIPSNLNPTSHPLQAVSPEAGPGQQGIDGFVTPRSFHKVEQWLGRMNNPPPQRNTSHTDEESATSQGRKIQDHLQKRRPGKINISKITLHVR